MILCRLPARSLGFLPVLLVHDFIKFACLEEDGPSCHDYCLSCCTCYPSEPLSACTEPLHGEKKGSQPVISMLCVRWSLLRAQATLHKVSKRRALEQVRLLFYYYYLLFIIVAMAEIAELVEEVRRLREEVKAGQEETSRKLARSGRKESYAFKRKANDITKQARKMPHLKSVLCMCIPRQCYKMIWIHVKH